MAVEEKSRELGFGASTTRNNRFVNSDGSLNIERKGLPFFRPYDTYHALITMSWGVFMFWLSLGFVFINAVFAIVYVVLGIDGLTAVSSHSIIYQFWDAFFFSIQTITTVGYGYFSPSSFGIKLVSSIESFIGLLGFALATGLLYGRFSRPVAKIKYAKKAVIAPFKDGKAFMFKMANQRSSKLIEAEVSLVFSAIDIKTGGRIYESLDLQLKKINFFALSWTVVHPINDESPLRNMTTEVMENIGAEFIILVKAFDDTFSQTVYSRMSYRYNEVEFDAKYKSSIKASSDGKMTIDLTELDDYEKINN